MSNACLSIEARFRTEAPASFHDAEVTSGVRMSIVPSSEVAARLTLPPRVRAARMMKTVRQIAGGLARRLPRNVDVDDLVGAGSLGLADALSRRNGMPAAEFEAFASYRIRGAMFDELRRLDAMPRRSRARAKQMAQASRRVEQREGAAASEELVAAELGMEMPEYQEMRGHLEARRAPIQLSAMMADDDETPIDLPGTGETPDTVAIRAEIGRLVSTGIHMLPERMRRVLVGLYVEGETLKQIGVTLGVSESRVCQIHTEALAILRNTVAANDSVAPPPASGVHVRPTARRRAAQASAK